MASSCINLTPFNPNTFAISWGSVNIVVVPCAITACANWPGVSIPLSICICASQSPGIANRPSASIVSVFFPIQCVISGPQYANLPFLIAIFVFGKISRV